MAEAIAPLAGEDLRAVALHVVMLGAPGVGKGTQAARLAAEAGIPRISTGDILRAAVAADTPLGRSARALMEAGQLVGDDIVVELVRERLARPDAAAGFVLDGFPRTVAQAEALDALMRSRGSLVVINVAVPTEELVRRLSSRRVCGRCGADRPAGVESSAACPRCGGTFVQRPDDAEEVVRERLRVFARQTEPLVTYYRAGSTVFDVDGDQPVDRVAEQVRGIVRQAAANGGGARQAS